MNKVRLDSFLVTSKLVESRNKAQDLIKEGNVTVNGIVIDKPNFMVTNKDEITINNNDDYVSRAAYKLVHAINEFKIDLKNKVVLDIGSSTGGFTQVSLMNKANKVYSIDVGTDQMHQSLRNNSKVKLFEQTNFKNIKKDIFEEKVDFVLCDVSFISLIKIIDRLLTLFDYSYNGVFLIKPQFELEDIKIKNFNGVVTNEETRKKIIQKIENILNKNHFKILGLCESPILGRKGNKEYLIYVKYK